MVQLTKAGIRAEFSNLVGFWHGLLPCHMLTLRTPPKPEKVPSKRGRHLCSMQQALRRPCSNQPEVSHEPRSLILQQNPSPHHLRALHRPTLDLVAHGSGGPAYKRLGLHCGDANNKMA